MCVALDVPSIDNDFLDTVVHRNRPISWQLGLRVSITAFARQAPSERHSVPLRGVVHTEAGVTIEGRTVLSHIFYKI